MGQHSYEVSTDEGRDIETDVRKALSAVARLDGEWGAHMIADVLTGSERKKVVENDLDELSVHGIIDDLSKMKVVAMLEVLVDRRLLRRANHKCLRLTAAGTAVMLKKRKLTHKTRIAVAEAQKTTKSYPDITERYSLDSPTIKKTLHQLRAGRHPRMIARSRDLAESTISDHIMFLAALGESFDLTPHLDVELLEELRRKAPGWKPGDAMTPIRESLVEDECDWAKLKLHLVQVFRE